MRTCLFWGKAKPKDHLCQSQRCQKAVWHITSPSVAHSCLWNLRATYPLEMTEWVLYTWVAPSTMSCVKAEWVQLATISYIRFRKSAAPNCCLNHPCSQSWPHLSHNEWAVSYYKFCTFYPISTHSYHCPTGVLWWPVLCCALKHLAITKRNTWTL